MALDQSIDKDVQLSAFTLRHKLGRHRFDFKYDEVRGVLKIGRARPSKKFVFYWLVLPAIIFVCQFLVIQLLPSSNPLRRLDYFSYLTSFWLTISSGIIFDQRRLNKSFIEVGSNYLKIVTKSDEYHYVADEIVGIEIDSSKNYEKESGFNFFRRGHLIVETEERSHHIIYIFGEKLINNWDDLRYFRKHISKLLYAEN